MSKMGRGLGLWVGCGALINACSPWVDLESPTGGAPSGAEAGGAGGGRPSSAGASSNLPGSPEAGAGTAAVGAGGRGPMSPPVAEQAGGNGDEGGDSSVGGGSISVPGLFDALDPPPPELVPSGADAPGVTWAAQVLITGGSLDGALVGYVDYLFQRESSQYIDWMARAPFVWTEAGGMDMLDRLLPGVMSYLPESVTEDGQIVLGTYASEDGNESGFFRWTASDGATKIGLPAGGGGGGLWVSADGAAAVTRQQILNPADQPDRVGFWTTQSGYRTLSDLPAWPAGAQVYGLSQDGSTVLGAALDTNSERGFRWTEQTGVEFLGELPGLPNCVPAERALPKDRTATYGFCASADADRSERKAFRWTETGGMTALQDSAGCAMSLVDGVSQDRAIAFGTAFCDGGNRLARWSTTSGFDLLPAAPPSFAFTIGTVTGVDRPGTTLIGSSDSPGSAQFGFRWSANAGYARLPPLPGDTDTYAISVDPTGGAVAGFSTISQTYDDHAALWDASGALDVADYLQSRGVDLQRRSLTSAVEVVVHGDKVLARGTGKLDAREDRAWIAYIPLVR